MHNKLNKTFFLVAILVITGFIFTSTGLTTLLSLSGPAAATISAFMALGLLAWATDSSMDILNMTINVTLIPAVAMGMAIAMGIPETEVGIGAFMLYIALAMGTAAIAPTDLITGEAVCTAAVGVMIVAMASAGVGSNSLFAISSVVSSLALATGLQIHKNHKQIAEKNIRCTFSLVIVSTFLALSAVAALISALVFSSAVAFTCSTSLAVTATSALLFAAVSLLRGLSLSLRSYLTHTA